MKAVYHPPSKENWTGRSSETADYLHENIQLLDLSKKEFETSTGKNVAILGYTCDAGVSRNSGRPGAAAGPAALRKALGKLPWPVEGPHQLWDAGDVRCIGDELEATQELFSTQITNLLNQGILPIAIGGGHDIAFGHYLGIRNHLTHTKTLGIINFDAHLDLRKPNPEGHSGSPFYQIAEYCREQQTSFHYACIGMREDANPKELLRRADALGVLKVTRWEMTAKNDMEAVDKITSFISRVDAVYLTLDLDGFSSAVAPGVSAASPMGYYPENVMPFLDLILRSKKLIAVDIAELNPEFDRDNQTALLAASLVHKIFGDIVKHHK
jgi:formiminoglutamase